MDKKTSDKVSQLEDKSANNVQPKYANVFRVQYTETDFTLDFGLVKAGENEISIVESITFPSTVIQDLLIAIFSAALKYEDTFNKDIGFKSIPRNDESGK